MPDVLDRLSQTLFSGSAWTTTTFRNLVSPLLKSARRFNRRHTWLSSTIKFILIAGCMLGGVHIYQTSRAVRYWLNCRCCFRKQASNKVPVDVRLEKMRLAREKQKQQ